MSKLEAILFMALLFSNWWWFTFFTSYRSEVARQLKKRGIV